MYYYSKSKNGFPDPRVLGDKMPDDAVEISAAKYAEISEGQNDGWYVDSDANGYPVLRAPVPVRVVPSVVTMRQARLALLEVGRLADVNHAIAALDGSAQAAALIEWEYAQTVERGSPFVAQLATALELDTDTLNDLFELAATL